MDITRHLLSKEQELKGFTVPKELKQYGQHFAAFPEKIPEICIKASTSEYGVCAKCGAPWARVVDNKPMVIRRTNHAKDSGIRIMSSGTMLEPNEVITIGWRPTCKCKTEERRPASVIDPFAGSGTTLQVATKLGRESIGYELSGKYCNLNIKRCKQLGLSLL